MRTLPANIRTCISVGSATAQQAKEETNLGSRPKLIGELGKFIRNCLSTITPPSNVGKLLYFFTVISRRVENTHSTETAYKIILSMDRQEVALLVLIDLSAATERGILLETRGKDFGVMGGTQQWLASYLSYRKQRILMKNCISDAFNFGTKVPPGKLSGTSSILNIRCWVIHDRWQTPTQRTHGYADDTQICLSFRAHTAASQGAALRNIENSVADVRAWMLSDRLLINDTNN